MANPQRSTLKLNSKAFYTGKTIDLNYKPKIDLSVFEVLPGAMHPGTPINNLVDVSGKSTQEIIDAVKSFDPRAVTNIPNVVEKEIKLGNISHIFTTDPTKSGGFMNLSAAEQQNVIDNTKGSVYFRTKEGKTARWKLPEISSGDSGWNANMGHGIFSDQTVYLPSEDIMSLTRAEATVKRVQRGALAAEDVDPRLLSGSVLGDILAGKKQTIGFGEALDVDAGGAAKGAVTQPTASTASSATTPVKVGKPTNSSTTVPSRTNQPTVNRSATVSPPKPATDRPIINTGTRVVDDAISLDPAKASERVIVSGTESGSAHVTAKVSSSSTRAAANTAEAAANSGAAPKVISSTARNLDDRLSKFVAGGIKEAKNLRVAGAAVAALGVGYLALKGREKNQESHRRSLMMQRQGIYR